MRFRRTGRRVPVFAELGDVHAGIDDSPYDIGELLEWSERDEQEHGQGDAPYPPNFPKMEGEPPRVQPSKINKANWTAQDEPQPLD